jgi:hypothetical protein
MIAEELTIYVSNHPKDSNLDHFIDSIKAELRPSANELYVYKSSLSDTQNEKLEEIVYEIMRESYKRLYTYYSQKDDVEESKKGTYYKELLNTLDKRELEKLLRTL